MVRSDAISGSGQGWGLSCVAATRNDAFVMKTLVVMNEKGGVGKTTLAAHAGWYFAERHRTLVIDLDQQANLTATLGAHLAGVDSVALFAEVAAVAPIGSLTATRSTRDLLGVEGADRACIETFRNSLASMANEYDICIIDTPPALTNRTFAALLAADAVLAPVGLNDYSLQGVAELLRAIKGVSSGSVALSDFCQKMALFLLNNFCWELLNATEPCQAACILNQPVGSVSATGQKSSATKNNGTGPLPLGVQRSI